MQDRIKVLCQNTSVEVEVEMGITLGELLAQLGIEDQYPILAAFVNNRLKELNSRLFKPAVVRFIDITHFEGYRVYQRTISFILHKAVWDIYGDRKFYIRHSLGRGFYCEFGDDKPITDEEIEALRKRMQEIIDSRYTIQRSRLLTSEESKKLPGNDVLASVGGPTFEADKAEQSKRFQEERRQSLRASVHKVQKGESLSTIARKRGTTVARLCKLNNIKTTTVLRVGQILKCS